MPGHAHQRLMAERFTVRAALASEQGFVASRAMGEFRRARLGKELVDEGAKGFLRWLLARPDAKAFVVDAGGVLIGAAVGAADAVAALHLPEALRSHAVLLELVRAVVAHTELAVPWLVPPPWWTRRLTGLVPYHDPFRLWRTAP